MNLRRGLQAVGNAELLEYAGQVRPDGAFSNAECDRDFCVRLRERDTPGDVLLAFGCRVQSFVICGCAAALTALTSRVTRLRPSHSSPDSTTSKI